MNREKPTDEHVEVAIVGELTDNESQITEKLLEVPPGGECTIYFNSPGGSPYSGLSLMSLILLRELQVTAVVTGECSSAALWPFAACSHRLVTPFCFLLFHPMKWQSDEQVLMSEAAEWARHFGQLEGDMDTLLADLFGISVKQIERWMRPGRYVSASELVEAELAEMIEFQTTVPKSNGTRSSTSSRRRKPVRVGH
ncbi:MAG: ATP-dependent Clp protease proteolytic subunit [Pirellulales bacterium]|nr:ATP-dependent Clp protease proteolytic subunit [Pirellulales bacterium]